MTSYLLQTDGVSRFTLASGSGFILLADGPISPPVVVTKPAGGGHHGHGGARYDRPKRIILPNGEHVIVHTQDEYFRLMDKLIAGLVPEAVEPVPQPSKAQVKRAKAKTAQAALKLEIPAETIEQRIAEQMALSRAAAEAKVYPVTRVSLRTKRLAPTLQDKMQFAEIARMLREAIQEENDEEEFIVNMVMELI